MAKLQRTCPLLVVDGEGRAEGLLTIDVLEQLLSSEAAEARSR